MIEGKTLDKQAPVAFSVCEAYDEERLYQLLSEHFSRLGINKEALAGKRVVVKPNLVRKAKPEEAVTTHPAVMSAVLRLLKEYSPASLILAESPGGPFMEAPLRAVYNATGMTEAAKKNDVELSFDTTYEELSDPDGEICKAFDIISPVVTADVIVNVCKLKTHALTLYSGAVKNYFGTVPGVRKFEMHSRFSDPTLFQHMIADLCAFHHRRSLCINIADGIVGMEGNGPSNGHPKTMGALFTSLNAFNLDVAATHLMTLEGVEMLEDAKRRGFCAGSVSELTLLGDDLNVKRVKTIEMPDSKKRSAVSLITTICNGRLNRLLEPIPVVNKKKCVGCGECVRSCPQKTIVFTESKKKKKLALIRHADCIKCYCCQELCPFDAIKIRKSAIFNVLE